MDVSYLRHLWDDYMTIARDLPQDQLIQAKCHHLTKFLDFLLEILPKVEDQFHCFLDLHNVSVVLSHELMVSVKNVNEDDTNGTMEKCLQSQHNLNILIILALVGVRDLVHGLNFGRCLVSVIGRLIANFSCNVSLDSQTTELSEIETFHMNEIHDRETNEFENSEVKEYVSFNSDLDVDDDVQEAVPRDGRAFGDAGPRDGRAFGDAGPRDGRAFGDAGPRDGRSFGDGRSSRRTKECSTDSDSDSSLKFSIVELRELRRMFRNSFVPNLVSSKFFQSIASNLRDESFIDENRVNKPEMCLLLLTILKDVCFDDDQFKMEKSVCMELLPIVGDLLKSYILQLFHVIDVCFTANGIKTFVLIGRCLVRILTVILSKIILQVDGINEMQSDNTADVVLQLLHDRLRSTESRVNHDLMLLFHDCAVSFLLNAKLVMTSISAFPIKLDDALHAVEPILCWPGVNVIEFIFLSLDQHSTESCCSHSFVKHSTIKLLHLIETLVASLKTVRASYVNMVAGGKRLDQRCKQLNNICNHHHDILGSSAAGSAADFVRTSQSSVGSSNRCVIAGISLMLLDVYKKCTNAWSKYEILSCLKRTGFCCCMSLDSVLSILLQDFDSHTSRHRALALDLFTSSLVTDFAGRQNKASCRNFLENCLICNDCNSSLVLERSSSKELKSEENRDPQKCTVSLESAQTCRWHCITRLLPVLYNGKQVTVVQLMKTFSQLLNIGTMSLKYELLHCIILPLFQKYISSKITSNQNFIEADEISLPVLQYCFCLLPDLLKSIELRRLFFENDGMNLLKKFVATEFIRPFALNVFQTMVLAFELPKKENSEPTVTQRNVRREVSCEASCQVYRTFENDRKSNLTLDQIELLELIFNLNGWLELDQNRASETYCLTKLSEPGLLGQTVDIWTTVDDLIANDIFRERFLARNGALTARALLFLSTNRFLSIELPSIRSDIRMEVHNNDGRYQEASCWLELSRSTLRVSLRCSPSLYKSSSSPNNTPPMDRLLSELCANLRDNLARGRTVFCASAVQLYCEVLVTHFKTNYCLQKFKSLDQEFRDIVSDQERTEFKQCSSDDNSIDSKGYEGDQDEMYEYENRVHEQMNCGSPCVHSVCCELALRVLLMFNETGSDKSECIVVNVLKLVLEFIKENASAVLYLHEQGMAYTLVSSFKTCLTSAKSNSSELKKCVLELFAIITRHGATVRDVGEFLSIFKQDDVCIEDLLTVLMSVASNISDHPASSLKIPLPYQSYLTSEASTFVSDMFHESKDESLKSLTRTRVDSREDSPTNQPSTLALQCAALKLPILPEMNLWPMKTSFSLWMMVEKHYQTRMVRTKVMKAKRVRRNFKTVAHRQQVFDAIDSSKKENLNLENSLHVITVGNEDYFFELWIDRKASQLIYRLLTHSGARGKIFAQGFISDVKLTKDRWHHLTFTFSEKIIAQATVATLMAIIDGSIERSVKISYKVHASSPNQQTSLYLGHAVHENQTESFPISCQIGNLFLFKDLEMTRPMSFYLYCLGPDCCSLIECELKQRRPTFRQHISSEFVSNEEFVQYHLNGPEPSFVEEMRNKMILIYNLSHPDMVVHHLTSVRRSLFLKSSSSIVERSIDEQPISIRFPLISDLASQVKVNRGTVASICQLGGISIFMFLFARVVELSQSETEQSDMLRIIFKLLQSSDQLSQEFVALDGYAMISKICLTVRCIVGFKILEVLLDTCTTEPVLNYCSDRGTYELKPYHEALIRDVQIITDILLVWTVWNKAADGVWLLAFQAINSLTSNKHRDFNIKVLLAAGVVEKLLNIFLERLQESYASLALPICQQFIEIIKNLIGAPPKIHYVINICDFLLLTHPAANAFAVHDKSSFYFRNKWVAGEQSSAYERYESYVKLEDSSACDSGCDDLNNHPDDKPTAMDANEKMNDGDSGQVVHASQDLDKTKSEVGCNSPVSSNPTRDIQQNCLPGNDNFEISLDSFSECSKNQSMGVNDSEICEIFQQEIQPNGNYPDHLVGRARESSSPECRFNVHSDDEMSSGQPQNSHCVDSESVGASDGTSDIDLERIANDISDHLKDFDAIHEIPLLSTSTLHDSIEKGDEGLVYTVARLLEMLTTLLPMMTDKDKERAFRIVLKPQVIIILANHKSFEIRKAILLMLQCHMNVALKQQNESLIKCNCFQLMANQIHQHKPSRELFETTLNIVINKSLALDKLTPTLLQLPVDTDQTQLMASILLMGYLENSTHSLELCHQMLAAVEMVFVGCSAVSQVMLQNGLVEVLCNVIHGINNEMTDSTSNVQHQQAIIKNLHSLFSDIAQKTFYSTGKSNYKEFKESFSLLQSLEARQKNLHGKLSDQSMLVTSIHHQVFVTVFDFFLEELNTSSDIKLSLTTVVHNTVENFISTFSFPKCFFHFQHFTPVNNNSLPSPKLGYTLPSYFKSSAVIDACPKRTGSTSFLHKIYQKMLSNKTSADGVGSSTGQSIQKRESTLTFSELEERLKKVVKYATDLVIFDNVAEDFEQYLLRFLFKTTATIAKTVRRSLTDNVLWQIKDHLAMQLSRLLVHVFHSTDETIERVLFIIDLFIADVSRLDTLKLLASVDPSMGYRLAIGIYNLINSNVSSLNASQRDGINELLDHLEQTGATVIRVGMKIALDDKVEMAKEMNQWREDVNQERIVWLKKRGRAWQKALHRRDGLLTEISDHAVQVTQTITYDQNKVRKKFLMHVRQQMSGRLQVKKNWQQTIMKLSHERGVWHFAKSYPVSWQLDPTEGPSRIRRKMQRCHLNMNPKFLEPEQQYKLDTSQNDSPLSYLFKDDKLSLDSAALIYKLHTSENIEYSCMCSNVSPQSTTSGALLVGQKDVYYVADKAVLEDNYTQALLGNSDDLFISLPYNDILEFNKQWYLLKDEALEIFLSNGKTCLLAFNSTKERDDLYSMLASLELPNLIQSDSKSDYVTKQWAGGHITNFEYMMYLNKLAGRSFNDLMQYPIFPFILSQYSQPTLDLTDPNNFRNLSKTISTQNSNQERKYLETYSILQSQIENGEGPIDIMQQPYHYQNYLSNNATVLQFNIRLPPFTQLFIEFQDRDFDCADRTFHSIQTTYRLATVDSTTDTRELIPEFFYLPEFLENNEGFNFGTKQNGQKVGDVVLPAWCNGDARLFTLIHRQALESDYVTQRIPLWIDLVFGYKQRGKAAIEAVNLYHPSTYFGLDVDALTDDLTRRAVKTMIKTYGQVPKRLLNKPHPFPTITPASHRIKDKPSPLPQVSGIRWGDYIGSPDRPGPSIVWFYDQNGSSLNLFPLPTGEVVALGPSSCLLVKQKGMKLTQSSVDLNWVGVISWHHKDGIVRLKHDKQKALCDLIQWKSSNQITCVVAVSDCNTIFFGTELGIIAVFRSTFNINTRSPLKLFDNNHHLYGHSNSVTCLQVCKPFSVLVSASLDGTFIIWDLNRLCFVKSVDDHKCSVAVLCVSDTSGDIASASHREDGSSCLMLHTVNGRLISSVNSTDQINCIQFSRSPEGRSVNLVLTGLKNGKMRLWSSWDLLPVRDLIPCFKSMSPILSVTFSHDGKGIVCADAKGIVYVWGENSVIPSMSTTSQSQKATKVLFL